MHDVVFDNDVHHLLDWFQTFTVVKLKKNLFLLTGEKLLIEGEGKERVEMTL